MIKTRQINTQVIKRIFKLASRREITQGSIVIAYYTLFSLFPIIIIAGNLLPLLHIDSNLVEQYLSLLLPNKVAQVILPVVNGILKKQSTGYISFGIVAALWSFSSLCNALRINMNRIYGVRQEEFHLSLGHKLFNRFLVVAITAMMINLLLLLAIALTLGGQLLDSLPEFAQENLSWIKVLLSYRWLVLTLGAIFAVAYLDFALPNITKKKRSLWPGVSVTVIGWMSLSFLFGIYLARFKLSFENYGIIGTFILFMLWLNLSSLILLFGVCVNAGLDMEKVGQDYIKDHSFLKNPHE